MKEEYSLISMRTNFKKKSISKPSNIFCQFHKLKDQFTTSFISQKTNRTNIALFFKEENNKHPKFRAQIKNVRILCYLEVLKFGLNSKGGKINFTMFI